VTVGADGMAFRWMIMVSDLSGQVPLLITQRKPEVPGLMPVMVELGADGVVMMPDPLKSTQLPVPMAGILPVSEVLSSQINLSGPAMGCEGCASRKIMTESLKAVQTPFETDQTRMLFPTERLLKSELGSVVEPMLLPPTATDHEPVPTDGELAASATVSWQTNWSGPALGAVGPASRVMTTSSVDDVQTPLEMVQRKVTLELGSNPVIDVVAEVVEVIDALPLTTDQEPDPKVGLLAANEVELLQIVWSGPALDEVGAWKTVIPCVVLMKPKV
jgi:hypothetical protein